MMEESGDETNSGTDGGRIGMGETTWHSEVTGKGRSFETFEGEESPELEREVEEGI